MMDARLWNGKLRKTTKLLLHNSTEFDDKHSVPMEWTAGWHGAAEGKRSSDGDSPLGPPEPRPPSHCPGRSMTALLSGLLPRSSPSSTTMASRISRSFDLVGGEAGVGEVIGVVAQANALRWLPYKAEPEL